MLFSAGGTPGVIDGPVLALLAGYGLAYCYIASAPILVFHVARFLFEFGSKRGSSILRLIIGFAPPFIATVIFYFTNSSAGAVRHFFTMVFCLAALVVWPQYLAIIATLFKQKAFFSFYQKLANKRGKSTSDIVSSYKHMREHGNSFFIVILEIILAIILFAAGNFDFASTGVVSESKHIYAIPYVFIILIWTLPAALVWLVGTLFEREFSGV